MVVVEQVREHRESRRRAAVLAVIALLTAFAGFRTFQLSQTSADSDVNTIAAAPLTLGLYTSSQDHSARIEVLVDGGSQAYVDADSGSPLVVTSDRPDENDSSTGGQHFRPIESLWGAGYATVVTSETGQVLARDDLTFVGTFDLGYDFFRGYEQAFAVRMPIIRDPSLRATEVPMGGASGPVHRYQIANLSKRLDSLYEGDALKKLRALENFRMPDGAKPTDFSGHPRR